MNTTKGNQCVPCNFEIDGGRVECNGFQDDGFQWILVEEDSTFPDVSDGKLSLSWAADWFENWVVELSIMYVALA